jgi:hypothetical protein
MSRFIENIFKDYGNEKDHGGSLLFTHTVQIIQNIQIFFSHLLTTVQNELLFLNIFFV